MVTIHRDVVDSKEIHFVSVKGWKYCLPDELEKRYRYFAIIEGDWIDPDSDYSIYLSRDQIQESQALNIYHSISNIKPGYKYMIIFSNAYSPPNYTINLVIVKNGKFNDYDVEPK